jgi:hypothetical protein
VADTAVFGRAPARFWPQGWWKLVDFRIGVVPAAVYLLLAALVAFFIVRDGKLASDLPTMIAVLALGGFGCAEIGKRLPVIRNIGAAAIFATFVPSYLSFAHLLPDGILKPVAEFTKASNFLYLFIAAVIVGSIFGMDRQVLIKGFLKIFVPLAVGSVVAGVVGTLVGVALGLGAYHTFFYTVIPIMAGGVGEGAIPLSIGYSEILHQEQGVLFAQVLPPIMLGSLTAILLSGLLNWVGKRQPHLTGEGRLQPGTGEELLPGEEKAASAAVDPAAIAVAGVTAIALYLLGTACFKLFGRRCRPGRCGRHSQSPTRSGTCRAGARQRTPSPSVWQWIRHRAKLEDGRTIDAALCRGLLEEELTRLRPSAAAGRHVEAAGLLRGLIEAPSLSAADLRCGGVPPSSDRAGRSPCRATKLRYSLSRH